MKKMKFTLIVTILLILIAGVWECKDTVTGGSLSTIVFPASNIPYSKVQQLFNAGCGGQSNACHGPDTFTMNKFSLDSYDHLIFGDIKVVLPKDPDASLLILTVEGKSTSKMPPSGQPQLNDNQKKGLRQWVKEGADGGY